MDNGKKKGVAKRLAILATVCAVVSVLAAVLASIQAVQAGEDIPVQLVACGGMTVVCAAVLWSGYRGM